MGGTVTYHPDRHDQRVGDREPEQYGHGGAAWRRDRPESRRELCHGTLDRLWAWTTSPRSAPSWSTCATLAPPSAAPFVEGQQARTFAPGLRLLQHPSTAKALSINLTVTQPSAAGHVRLFPAGQAVPTASTINYAAGQTRANNAIISLNASGETAAFVGQPAGTTVHLIIDVNGYFE